MEKELTLKDILIILLKKAKLILVCALICGIVAASYGAISSPTANNAANDAERYATELHIAETELAQAQAREKALNDYKMSSLYYSIDPYNAANCTIHFLVDTGNQTDPSLTSQEPDRTYNVTTAYTTVYKFDQEIMQHVVELLGGDVEEKYAAELIDVVASSGNTVKISVVHADVSTASKIAAYLFDATKRRINDTVMEHTTMLISDAAAYCVDDAIRAKQDAVDMELVNVRQRVVDGEKALNTLQRNPVSGHPQEIIRKRLVKLALIGLVLGAAGGCCIAVFGKVLADRLTNLSDVERYDFPMLGTLPVKSRKRWFDKWIRELENDPRQSSEASEEVLAANINAVAAGKRIALVGTCKQTVLDDLAERLGELVFAAGNVIQDASAVEALHQADGVLLVEIRGEAHLQQVDQLVQRLKTLDKEVIGIVLG